MTIILDEHFSFRFKPVLRTFGVRVDHVTDIGLASTEDRRIWASAATRDTVVVSKDRDFLGMTMSDSGPRLIHVKWLNGTNAEMTARIEASREIIAEFLLDPQRDVLILE